MAYKQKRVWSLVLMAAAILAVVGVLVLILVRFFNPIRVLFLPPPPARPALAYSSVPQQELDEALLRNRLASDERQTVVDAALSIVGEVPYFWGGKSEVVGKDPLWGEPMLVDSDGSETSGTFQPFGLDCSGYVSWCFLQCGIGFDRMKAEVGHGTSNQWRKADAISWDDLLPGDLVFQHIPGEGDGNHVGIIVGFADDGEPLIAHCAYSKGGVVVTGRGDIFVHARRPQFYRDEVFLVDDYA